MTDVGVVKCATLTLKLDVEDVKKAGDGGKKAGDERKEVDEKQIASVVEADGSGEGNTINAATTITSNGVATTISSGGSGIKQIDAVMTFGDTEIKVTALEVDSGKSVKATIDFLNL